MSNLLPIVNNISYSHLVDYDRCDWLYKLKHIEHLPDFTNSPETIYGTYIHEAIQDVLSGKIDFPSATKAFLRKWNKFCGIYKKYIKKDIRFGVTCGPSIISSISEFFKATFGDHKVLYVEERLALPASERWPQNFKGFVDMVLELSDGTIAIVDFKSCSSAYMFNQYKTKQKDYQLVLYKHFYSKKYNIDLNKIKTFFVLLSRDKKNPVSHLEITSGQKKINNALEWMSNALSAINRQVFFKNRSNCKMYNKDCTFYKTKHCP